MPAVCVAGRRSEIIIASLENPRGAVVVHIRVGTRQSGKIEGSANDDEGLSLLTRYNYGNIFYIFVFNFHWYLYDEIGSGFLWKNFDFLQTSKIHTRFARSFFYYNNVQQQILFTS